MPDHLRLGFVSVVRPLFKGDTQHAITISVQGLETLAADLEFELILIDSVSDADRATQAAEQIKGQKIDLLLIQHTTFATGDLLAPLLTAHPRVGVWALPERAGRRGSQGPLPLNALCGLNMTLSFLDHPNVNKHEPVKWFYGEVDSNTFKTRLMTTLAALRGLKATQNACILQIGGTAPNFWGIEEHPSLGNVQVDSLPLSDVFERVAGVSEDVAEGKARAWANEEVLEAPFAHLVQASKIELVLQKLADEGSYNALALRCWPEFPEACGAMTCSSVARLGDANLPTACEGDVMGALSMLVLQAISNAPSILMDLSDHDPSDDGLLFWHCGNAAKDWAAHPGSRLTTHFNRDDTGVVRDMVLQSGEATGFRLLDGGQAAVILEGRFDNPTKPSYDGVRGWFYDLSWNGQAVNAQTAISNILDRRLPHHLAFGKGSLTASLQEYCGWLGADILTAHTYQDALYQPQKDVHL
ncbi:MAG: fucose isomerase [Deinococcota bacterium]